MSERTFSKNEKAQFLNKLLQSGKNTEVFAKENGLAGRALRTWRAEMLAEVAEAARGDDVLASETTGGKARYVDNDYAKATLARCNLILARKAMGPGSRAIPQTTIAALMGATQVEVSQFERGAKYSDKFASRYAAALGYTLVAVQQFGFAPRRSAAVVNQIKQVTTSPISFGDPRRLTAFGIAREIDQFVGKTVVIESTSGYRDGHPVFLVRTGKTAEQTKG